MVARLSVLQGSTGGSPGPSSRPICFTGEPQAPLLCDSLPSQEGCGLRCHVTGLEQMAEDLSVPTSVNANESAGQAQGLYGQSNSGCSSLAQQPLVPSPHGASTSQAQVQEPAAVPECQRSDSLRLLLSDPAPSYVDLMIHNYGSRYRPESIEFLTTHLRPSTQNQYQSIWQSWLFFVNRSQPYDIDKDFLISTLGIFSWRVSSPQLPSSPSKQP